MTGPSLLCKRFHKNANILFLIIINLIYDVRDINDEIVFETAPRMRSFERH